MSIRNVFKNGVSIVSTFALMVAVVTFPMGASRSDSNAPVYNYLFHKAAHADQHPIRGSVQSANSGSIRVRALASRDVEELSQVLRPTLLTVSPSPTLLTGNVQGPMTTGTARAVHPLRC